MRTSCLEIVAGARDSEGLLKSADARCGVVAALMIGPERKKPMISVPEIQAIAGCGIEGDRYCREAGTFSRKSPSNQVTLVEMEALDAVARDYGLSIATEELRRNVLTAEWPSIIWWDANSQLAAYACAL